MGEEMNGSNVNSIFSDLYHAYLDNTTIITPGKTTLGGSPLRKLGIVSVFGRVNYNYKGNLFGHNRYASRRILQLRQRETDGDISLPYRRVGYYPMRHSWNPPRIG